MLRRQAALRTCSGYVTVAAPSRVVGMVAPSMPIFVYKKLTGVLEKDKATLKKVRRDSVVVGPGMEHTPSNARLVAEILKTERKLGNTVVVDAGALGPAVKSGISGAILTPHDGEFQKISEKKPGKTAKARISAAKGFAKSHKCILVLKGHETIITDGEKVKINKAKSPALATMGSGDVLDGIIASYAARHKNRFECAVAGVHVHSMIADKLFKKKGEHITAQDVIDAIPDTLKGFDVIK